MGPSRQMCARLEWDGCQGALQLQSGPGPGAGNTMIQPSHYNYLLYCSTSQRKVSIQDRERCLRFEKFNLSVVQIAQFILQC